MFEIRTMDVRNLVIPPEVDTLYGKRCSKLLTFPTSTGRLPNMVQGPIDATSARVLARQRHEVIVAEVRRRGAVRVSELATLLTVSDMTVRRDLDLLDEAGLLLKVHGGATLPD